jgi:DNA polymerase-1
VHPSFLLHGAATGRISAVKPAIQTIPAVDDKRDEGPEREYKLRDGSWVTHPMRRAFAPAPGRLWVEADYSQLELRVAAAISGDQAFMDVFRSGRDVHREVAAAIFSKDPDDITKPERYLAKAVSFGILYGRSAKALAEGAEMDYAVAEDSTFRRWDEATAEAFIRKFLQSYPDLTAWMSELQETAPVQGYVESPTGRRRRFPLVTDRELGAIQRQAVNTPVQGEASDICLRAFVALSDEVAASLAGRATMLFPVHDSICMEVEEDCVKPLEVICRSIMEIDFMGCPLTIDFEVGPSWADVK